MASFDSHLQRLEGAYAPSTIASYRTDFADFASWCRKKRLSALPATAATVASYIDARSESLKAGTLKRRVVAITKFHRLADLPSPAESEVVVLALRRAHRRRPGRPTQALGITAERRDRLMSACGDDLKGLRDKVLVAVGFDTLCRRSELVALRVQDFTRMPDGTFTVLIRRAKNDPEGRGRIARLSENASLLVETWLQLTRLTQGPLLRPVYKNTVPQRYLHPSFIGTTLKRLSEAAGYPEDDVLRVSGHSLRVGAAQTLTVMGLGILPIMAAGGWKSMNVVARYVENVEMNVWQRP